MKHSLKMVLYCPQIPPNTGNIARTCAATETQLHLIKPLGFSITDRSVKRAGLDYWDYVDLITHESFEDFQNYRKALGGRLLSFSAEGKTNFKGFEYRNDDWIMHGREADGIPEEILKQCDQVLYIPMSNSKIRSLNLAVCAALSLYEGIYTCNK